ncbi:hypothetical protein F5B21DRAFT_493812 [Xylaria acuta]|nr:hypothetical protein F5B21DRAFT_493812 [Xylaria acuta]
MEPSCSMPSCLSGSPPSLHDRVIRWVDSISDIHHNPPSQSHWEEEEEEEEEEPEPEPRTKRRKLTHRECSDKSGHMSGRLTPPISIGVRAGAQSLPQQQQQRKRRNDEMERDAEIEGNIYNNNNNNNMHTAAESRYKDNTADAANAADQQPTPRPPRPSRPSRPDFRFVLPPSPTKRTASPVKVPDQLRHLETPVYRQPMTKEAFQNDPCLGDVQDLHSQIKRAMLLRDVIPAEVRGDIESIDRESEPEDDLAEAAYERRFRSPAADVAAQARLRADFEMLRRVQQQAEDCKELSSHEGAWNNLVHTPLLCHVFRDRRRPLPTEPCPAVGTRLEPAMHATIQADSIPVIRQAGRDPVGVGSSDDDAVASETYALSIEGSQISAATGAGAGASVGDGASVCSRGSVKVNLATNHSRSDAKRVDYVVVMDVFETGVGTGADAGVGLKERIEEINLHIWSHYKAPYHVNQTAYKAVADSPIALSVETKKALSPDEPLLQLGIWIAAWHKRMTYLRQLLIALTRDADAQPSQRLTSVPLIQVVGHDWDIYFACFAGGGITLYGPVRMGSTTSLVQVYALLASLEAIRAWIKSTYKKRMEDWFMCASIQ